MTQFNPIAEEGLPAQIRRIELELRSLQQQLAQALVGGRVNLTHVVGVLPPGSGGTGGTTAPFGVTIMKNTSGGTVEAGSTVVVKTAAQEFTTTTTLGDPKAFGIAVEDIANNAFGPVRVVGYQATVLVTGAVTAGDYLRPSTTVKRAISSGTDFTAGCFAIAQTAAAGPGSGTVSAVVIATERLQSQVTAAGDLLAGFAAGDLDALHISGSSDGDVLTRDDAETLKMKWAPPDPGSGSGPIPIPFGSTVAVGHGYTSTTASDWQRFGEVERILDSDQYSFSPLRVVLEVILASGAGQPAYARLYDITLAAEVSNSVIQTSQLIGTRIRSPYISLNSAEHRYEVQFAPTANDEAICYDALLWVGSDELTAGNNIPATTDEEDDDVPNEVMNFPSLENVDNALPDWWTNNNANAVLTEVDVAGEGITEKYERCLKLVVSTASSYSKQLFTYADQPRLKSGQVVSVSFDVWAVAGAQAGVRLQSSVGSLGVANSTAASWTRLAVEGVALDGTTVEIRLEGAVGTYYFAPLGFRVGATAPTAQLRPRGLRYRDIDTDPISVKVLTGKANENTWTDVDITANTSGIACRVALECELGETTAGNTWALELRRKGAAGNVSKLVIYNTIVMYGVNHVDVLLDAGQVFQYLLNRQAGATTLDYGEIFVMGYWEWE